MYKKVDNVFGKNFLNHLRDKIEAPGEFPWYFYKNTQTGVYPSEFKNSGFGHTAIRDGVNQSAYTNLFLPIAWKVSEIISKPIISIDRIRASMVFNLGIEHGGEPHIDIADTPESDDFKQFTAIYYLDDTNGCTTLYDNKGAPFFKNPSTADSLLIFSANILHSGGLPTDAPLRRVVNINITCHK